MTGLARSIVVIMGMVAFALAGAATAQENLDAGKTPAELYASDCAICHKSPRGLSHVGGLYGLEGFLREHYTASRESAAKIAGYLRHVDRAPARRHRRAAHPTPRPRPTAAKKKPAEQKPAENKAAEQKPAEKKAAAPEQAKATETKATKAKATEKATEAKATEKATEAKATEKKPALGKPSASETGEAKPGEVKRGTSKPEGAKARAEAMTAPAEPSKPKVTPKETPKASDDDAGAAQPDKPEAPDKPAQ